MFEWVKAASEAAKTTGQFAVGVGKGVWDFGKDAVGGVKDLAVAGHKLLTDGQYREQTWQATKELAKTAK